jgi:hypothetical protein
LGHLKIMTTQVLPIIIYKSVHDEVVEIYAIYALNTLFNRNFVTGNTF